MANEFKIVEVNGDGEEVATHQKDFCDFTTSRREFGNIRHSDIGKDAVKNGNTLQLLADNVIKMSHPLPKKEKKAPGKKKQKVVSEDAENDGEEKIVKKKAATKKRKSEEPELDEDGEPKKKKISGYIQYTKESREDVKAAIAADPANAELSAKEKSGLIFKTQGAQWKLLSDEEQQAYKDRASEVKPKEAKKEAGGPKKKRDKVKDDAELTKRMEADGWETVEKEKAEGSGVDRTFQRGAKKYRSKLEVARANYPDLVEVGAASSEVAPEPKTDNYYLGQPPPPPSPKEAEEEEEEEEALDEEEAAQEDPKEDEEELDEEAAAEEAAAEEAAVEEEVEKVEDAKMEEEDKEATEEAAEDAAEATEDVAE